MRSDPFSQWRVPVDKTEEAAVSSSHDPFSQWRVKEEPSQKTPHRSLGKAALRQAGRIARAGATGIAGLADIPNLAALGLHAAGLKKEPTFYEPIAGKVQQGIDELTGGTLAPENKAEEYMDIIGEGLAPLALAPVTGGASLTAAAARGLPGKVAQKVAKMGSNPYKITSANVAGSAGSSAALKSYLDEGGDPNVVGALLASMAGGAGARGALKLKNPLNAAAEGIGRATGFSPEKYAKNVELGLPVTPATVSNNQLPGYVEMVAAKMPGSMKPLEDFYKGREAAIARNLGVRTPSDLEQSVRHIPKHLAKEGAEGYHQQASKKYKNMEEKFKPREEQAITNKELVDVSNDIEELERKRSRFLSPASQKRFDKTKDGILLKELKESVVDSPQNLEAMSLSKSLRSQGYPEDLINKVVRENFGDINSNKKGIGLHDLNSLREKALQESIELKTPIGGGTPESSRAAERSHMLSSRRHQFIQEVGSPSEIYNARKARLFWARYKDEKNGMSKYVSKLTGTDNDAAAFNKLIGPNPNYLKVARQGLNKAEGSKLAEAIIADLGERQGRFNVNTAYTGFHKLEEPVKQEFLKTLPNKAASKNFEETMKFIGNNKKMMESLANTSNTAHSNHIIDLMKRYGAATAAAATGYGIMPLTGLVATFAGLKLGAKIWTNQNFLRRMNDVISAKNQIGKTNKLDLLMKSVNQAGRHIKHIENSPNT